VNKSAWRISVSCGGYVRTVTDEMKRSAGLTPWSLARVRNEGVPAPSPGAFPRTDSPVRGAERWSR
jgi:hypothetical protein